MREEVLPFTGITKANTGEFNMHAEDYQNQAKLLMLPTCKDLNYLTLGLNSEAGEVADIVKRLIRGDVNFIDKHDLALELGDCLWYISMIAELTGITLSDIMSKNLTKLTERQEKGRK